MGSNGSIGSRDGDPIGRREPGRELEATLVELVDLALLGKQLQWCGAGPLFPILHPRLGELVESWRRMADKMAERATAVGHCPDGQAEAIAASAEHTAVPSGPVEDEAIVPLLVQCLSGLIDRVRDRIARLGEEDLTTHNLLAEMVGEVEQQSRLLRAQLPFGGEPAADSKKHP